MKLVNAADISVYMMPTDPELCVTDSIYLNRPS